MGINPCSPGSPNKQNGEQQLGINLGSPDGGQQMGINPCPLNSPTIPKREQQMRINPCLHNERQQMGINPCPPNSFYWEYVAAKIVGKGWDKAYKTY